MMERFHRIMLLASVLLLMCFFPFYDTCGVSTHISIAHEASSFMSKSTYQQIVQANQDAFVAGNPYPDFAYAKQCFNYKYHDVSETTHWAPFLNATVNYIRRNYKQPWNLVTFFYFFLAIPFFSEFVMIYVFICHSTANDLHRFNLSQISK